jgi:N-acetylglucosamine-6-phosphate deacetylase
MKSISDCGRSIVTLAPECVPPSLIDDLLGAGLRLSAGHSDATQAQIEQAADRGVTGVTHLFNAMSQLTAREPGVVGAALDDERLFAGIICDGLHVDPLSLRVAMRCKGPDRLMLITDAMPPVGTDLRHFLLQGRRITLQGARLTGSDGTLAGAHLTMMQAVRNAVALLGVGIADVLTMASRTPATFLGLESQLGTIAPGYRADLVAFSSKFEVIETWVAGQPNT